MTITLEIVEEHIKALVAAAHADAEGVEHFFAPIVEGDVVKYGPALSDALTAILIPVINTATSTVPGLVLAEPVIDAFVVGAISHAATIAETDAAADIQARATTVLTNAATHATTAVNAHPIVIAALAAPAADHSQDVVAADQHVGDGIKIAGDHTDTSTVDATKTHTT